jgi:hypothetical protein
MTAMKTWLAYTVIALLCFASISSANGLLDMSGQQKNLQNPLPGFSEDEVAQAETVLREFLSALFAGNESKPQELATDAFRSRLARQFANPDYADFLRAMYFESSYQIKQRKLSARESINFDVDIYQRGKKTRSLGFRVTKMNPGGDQSPHFYVDGENDKP